MANGLHAPHSPNSIVLQFVRAVHHAVAEQGRQLGDEQGVLDAGNFSRMGGPDRATGKQDPSAGEAVEPDAAAGRFLANKAIHARVWYEPTARVL